MKVNTLILLGILSSLSLFGTGCAFSRTNAPVNFVATVNQPLKPGRKDALTVGTIKDSRSVNNPHVLVHKQNAYGTTTGAYTNQTAVADLLKNGLVQALQTNGFVGPDAKYELQGDIMEFDIDTVAGFWEATVKPKLVVRFELVEASSGRSVWHDTLIGRTTAKTAWGTAGFVGQIFCASADNLVEQLVLDRTFRSYFE